MKSKDGKQSHQFRAGQRRLRDSKDCGPRLFALGKKKLNFERAARSPRPENPCRRIDADEQAQSSTQLRGTVENKAPKPAGYFRKNTQQLVILGVAVVMVLIMWLTGSGKRRATSNTAPQQERVSNRRMLQLSKISNKQSNRNRQQRGSRFRRRTRTAPGDGLAGDVPPGVAGRTSRWNMPQPGGIVGGGAGAQPPPPPTPSKKTRRSGIPSLFAPNVAFTYRKPQEADQLVGSHGVSNALAQNTLQMPATTDLDAQVRQAEAQLWQRGKPQAREARGVTPTPNDQQKPPAPSQSG